MVASEQTACLDVAAVAALVDNLRRDLDALADLLPKEKQP